MKEAEGVNSQTKVLEEARELKGIDSEISLQRSGHFFL